MALLKNGQLVNDLWTILDDGRNPFSVDNPLITLESWKQHEVEIIRQNKPIGIFLRSDQSPEKIGESMDRFSLVAIDFPVFTDGRGFSYARILREQLGYKGELRAVGDVRRDQYLYMLRCGFNAFEIEMGCLLVTPKKKAFFKPKKKRRLMAPLKVGKQTKKLTINFQLNENQSLFDEASWLQE